MLHLAAQAWVLKWSDTSVSWVKICKRGAFFEACYGIFFNEIIEYYITNEEPMSLKKNLIWIIDKILYLFI